MRWTTEQVAAATGGSSVPSGARTASPAAGSSAGSAGEAARFSGVVIDSRRVDGGELFVALRGERDGHDFVGAAVAAGAGGVLAENGRLHLPLPVPVIQVRDTAAALLDLGSAARDRMDGQVVGITGSVGKTSTKDLTRAALEAGRRVAASEKSFNNELGVPLTLANAPGETQVTVVEMGARGPGHIALLCRVARPTIAVVTAVAAAHTETFGDLDAVAAAKGELVESLPPSGVAVLNGEDPRVSAMARRTSTRALLYAVARKAGIPHDAVVPESSIGIGATGTGADLIAESVELDSELRPRFVARTPWGPVVVRLEARGYHQVGNALAAIAVAGICGVPVEAAAAALERAPLSPWRMQLQRSPAGAMVINDAYNANPASMAAALEALACLPASRRVAFLGEMAELGQRSRDDHLAIAALAESLGIEVIPVGTDSYGQPAAADVADAIKRSGLLTQGTAVLVKGSRVAGLEALAEALVEGTNC